MTVGERIRDARKRAGLTQQELADMLGIPYQGISQYERGLRNPKIDTLIKIANALGVTAAYLDGSNSYQEMEVKLAHASHDSAKIAEALHLPPDMNDADIEARTREYLDWEKKRRQSRRNIQSLAAGLSNSLVSESDARFYVEWLNHLRKLASKGEKHLPSNAHIEYSYTFSANEVLLISNFSEMNAAGQEKVLEYAEDLVKIPEYQKNLSKDEALKKEGKGENSQGK